MPATINSVAFGVLEFFFYLLIGFFISSYEVRCTQHSARYRKAFFFVAVNVMREDALYDLWIWDIDLNI